MNAASVLILCEPSTISSLPVSSISATKIKGMIAAEVSDERSAYMTRAHNNTRIITVGSEIVGPGVAKNIAKGFVEGDYDGGRHQIRVDMLNKMC
jgi:galactose-6-phosphate isomerase